jgi:hypothetical protein
MIIRFTKSKDGKEPVLSCIRDDGSVTWQKSSEFFVRHDLIHYAVETILEYRQAFLGLVAGGKSLDDFGTRNGVKDTYTDEERWAELIVSALQIPSVAAAPGLTEAEVIESVANACRENQKPLPEITAVQITAIRERIRELHSQWSHLPQGESMELSF